MVLSVSLQLQPALAKVTSWRLLDNNPDTEEFFVATCIHLYIHIYTCTYMSQYMYMHLLEGMLLHVYQRPHGFCTHPVKDVMMKLEPKDGGPAQVPQRGRRIARSWFPDAKRGFLAKEVADPGSQPPKCPPLGARDRFAFLPD